MPPKVTCPNQHMVTILQKRVDELRKEKPDSFQIPGLLKALKNVRAHPQWLASGAEAQKAIAGIGPAVAKIIDAGIAELPAPPRPVVTEVLGTSLVVTREKRPFFETDDDRDDFYDLMADTVTPRRSRTGVDMPSLASRLPDTPSGDPLPPAQAEIGVLPAQSPLVGARPPHSRQSGSAQASQQQHPPLLTPPPPMTATPSSSQSRVAARAATSASFSSTLLISKRPRTIDLIPAFNTPNYAILVSLLAAKHAIPPVTLITSDELLPRTEPKLTPVLFESTMSDLLERGLVDVTSRKKQYCLTDEGCKLASDAYNLAVRTRKEQRVISGVTAMATPVLSPSIGPLADPLTSVSRNSTSCAAGRITAAITPAPSNASASHSFGPSPEMLSLQEDLDDPLLYPGRVLTASKHPPSRSSSRSPLSAFPSTAEDASIVILDSDDDAPPKPASLGRRKVADSPFIDSLGNAGDWRDSTFLSEELDSSPSDTRADMRSAQASSSASSHSASPPLSANRSAATLSALESHTAFDHNTSHWAASSRPVTSTAPSTTAVISLGSPSPEPPARARALQPAAIAGSSSTIDRIASSTRDAPLPPQLSRRKTDTSVSSSSISRSSSPTMSPSSSSLPRLPSTTPTLPTGSATASTTAAKEEAIPDAPTWAPIPVVTLPPESYDIVILLDNREQSRQDREFFQRHLQNQGVFVDTVTLPIGDMAWAARPKEGFGGPLGTLQRGLGPQTYILLDYIAERKRIDDLRTSIHDNRWIEQKWRLEGSGLTNLHYIVEEAAAVIQRVTSDPATVKAIMTAKVQTIAWSGFNLHVTRSDQETAALLAQITMMIARLWKPNPLYVVMSEHVRSRSDWTAFRKFGVVDPASKTLVPMTRPQLMSIWHHQGALNRCLMSPHILLSRLSDFSGKSSQVQLGDFFARMLMTIQGVSAEKARFLAKYFPTPYSLHEAYQKVPEADRPLFLARFFDDLEAQQGLLGRKKIKDALSRRIAEVMVASQYSDARVDDDGTQ